MGRRIWWFLIRSGSYSLFLSRRLGMKKTARDALNQVSPSSLSKRILSEIPKNHYWLLLGFSLTSCRFLKTLRTEPAGAALKSYGDSFCFWCPLRNGHGRLEVEQRKCSRGQIQTGKGGTQRRQAPKKNDRSRLMDSRHGYRSLKGPSSWIRYSSDGQRLHRPRQSPTNVARSLPYRILPSMNRFIPNSSWTWFVCMRFDCLLNWIRSSWIWKRNFLHFA